MATSGRPMAKRANTTSTRSQPEPGVRGRTAVFPVGKTVHVSGQAQARIVDSDIARKFDFPTHGQSDLPQRPSTSGGPASKTNLSAPKHFDKRETRDDLHLNPLAAHGKETTFYDFPLPGPLPKSATSSGSLSPTPFPLRKSSLAGSIRSETPDSPAGEIVNMESQLGIGMALGSPSHPPPQAQQPAVWNQHVRFDTPRVASPEEMSPMDNWSDAAVAPPKQKASKWKILGGFFGGGKKTGGPSPQQFYQVQPESGVQTTVEADFVSSPSNTAEKPRGRGRTNSERKTNKHKPDMKRANTAPSDSPMAFNFATERNAQMAGTPKITLDGGPMLNVDIPSVQMERYSVMFGSVLKPNAASSSALLARRQATLDKLKTVNEALQEKERELEEKERLLRPRRATSPQPTKSPAFSLFPNTPQRLTSRDPSPSEPRHRSPLHRSNTAPGALSPARSTFEDLPEPKKESKPKPVLHQAPPIAPPHHADGRPKPKHQPIVTQFSQEESHLDLTSPNGSILSYENDVYDPTPFPMKPKLYSPAWEMVTNHPTAGAGSTSSGSTLNSASSANTSVSSPLDTLVAPSRHRAGTVTNSTISTTSMDVPIAFAPPPLRERTNTTTKLKPIISAAEIAALSQQPLKGSVAAPSIPKSVSNNTRLNNNIPITKSSTPITRPQAQSQISHQKEVSSGAFSFEESRISEDEQQRLKTAADVSIARQISVSRQQRQLLIPIKKSSASPSPTNQSPVDKPRIKVKTELTGLGERLVDSPVRALTPTLVVVGGGPPDSRVRGMQVRKGSAIGAAHLGVVSNGNMELQHRKSERGVVERV